MKLVPRKQPHTHRLSALVAHDQRLSGCILPRHHAANIHNLSQIRADYTHDRPATASAVWTQAAPYAIFDGLHLMSWLEQKVLAYEQMRFAQEQNRRVLPFEWGLEHVGGDLTDRNPRAWLDQFVAHMLAHSDDWFATTPADDYELEDGVLTFTSAIESPWPENNRVHAQLF